MSIYTYVKRGGSRPEIVKTYPPVPYIDIWPFIFADFSALFVCKLARIK